MLFYLKMQKINNQQKVNSTNHNVFLIDHKNKICRLHPERIFSFLLSRRNMFVMSMGITVSYHINNIECTPLHIFLKAQATSSNMKLCTTFCWKSLLPLETCDWENLYCQNSSHHLQQKRQPRMKVYTQFWLYTPHFWHPL